MFGAALISEEVQTGIESLFDPIISQQDIYQQHSMWKSLNHIEHTTELGRNF